MTYITYIEVTNPQIKAQVYDMKSDLHRVPYLPRLHLHPPESCKADAKHIHSYLTHVQCFANLIRLLDMCEIYAALARSTNHIRSAEETSTSFLGNDLNLIAYLQLDVVAGTFTTLGGEHRAS